MKTSSILALAMLFGPGLMLPERSSAAPAMRGPLPKEQSGIIHSIATRHSEFKRVVEITADGYTATTTTENKELAGMLKSHLRYMKARLDSKAMVRRWDPAFAEMTAYYDQLETSITELDDGVKVVVKGKSPEAIKVAQNHARIVTGFVAEGDIAVQRKHDPALPAKAEE